MSNMKIRCILIQRKIINFLILTMQGVVEEEAYFLHNSIHVPNYLYATGSNYTQVQYM